MFLSEDQYLSNLGTYMVRKCDFIEFVMRQWQQYTVQFTQELEVQYNHYDSFSNKDGLNQSQFTQLIKDLKINTVFSFQIQDVEELFNAANQGQRLDFSALKDLLIEKNPEIIPFNRYVHNKFQTRTNRKEGTSKLSCYNN